MKCPVVISSSGSIDRLQVPLKIFYDQLIKLFKKLEAEYNIDDIVKELSKLYGEPSNDK
jgi:hypothetical protein